MARGIQTGVEQGLRPVRRGPTTVAVQLRMISKCFGNESPNAAGNLFPLMTEEVWLDWIGRLNDFVFEHMNAMEQYVKANHNPSAFDAAGQMAKQAAHEETTLEIAARIGSWIAMPEFAGRETRSLEFSQACQLRIEAVLETKMNKKKSFFYFTPLGIQ